MSNLTVHVFGSNRYILNHFSIHSVSFQLIKHKHRSNITKKSLEVEMVAIIPRIQVDGSYKGKGRFNLLNMNSKVSFDVSMSKFPANSSTNACIRYSLSINCPPPPMTFTSPSLYSFQYILQPKQQPTSNWSVNSWNAMVNDIYE